MLSILTHSINITPPLLSLQDQSHRQSPSVVHVATGWKASTKRLGRTPSLTLTYCLLLSLSLIVPLSYFLSLSLIVSCYHSRLSPNRCITINFDSTHILLLPTPPSNLNLYIPITITITITIAVTLSCLVLFLSLPQGSTNHATPPSNLNLSITITIPITITIAVTLSCLVFVVHQALPIMRVVGE